MAAIKQIYWTRSDGTIQKMEKRDRMDLYAAYQGPTGTILGSPKYWSLDLNTISLFNTPDSSGPSAGNYVLTIEGYNYITEIVETTGNTAASTTLTLPATGTTYLTAKGVPAVSPLGATVSIRGAGATTISASTFDYFQTTWTAFPSASTVTLGAVPNQTAVTAAQTFFNSSNWVMLAHPKVFLFGVLREVANFLGADLDYQKWEARLQLELEEMADFQFDRVSSVATQAMGGAGQRQNSLFWIDSPYDYWGTGVGY